MNTVDTYRFCLLIVNREINGDFSPNEFNRFFNRAQIEYMRELIGDPAQFQPGREIPRNHVGTGKSNIESLSPFRKAVSITLTDGAGNYNVDEDAVWGPVSVTSTGYENTCDGETTFVKKRTEVEMVKDAEWGFRTNDPIDKPTNFYPIYRRTIGTNIEVAPYSIRYVEVVYYRKPIDVSVGFNVVQGRPQLDPTAPNNVDPEWGELDMNQLIFRTLSYKGVNISYDRLMAYSERKTEAGT